MQPTSTTRTPVDCSMNSRIWGSWLVNDDDDDDDDDGGGGSC